MTDKELLELAARAAGIDYWVVRFASKSAPIEKLHITKDGTTVEWNPLTDDGDVLRLAVKLELEIINDRYMCVVRQRNPHKHGAQESLSLDPYAATRRAIVRAAAEIGKDMK